MKLSHLAISLVSVFAASNILRLANDNFEAVAASYGFVGVMFILLTGLFLMVLAIVMFFRAFRRA